MFCCIVIFCWVFGCYKTTVWTFIIKLFSFHHLTLLQFCLCKGHNHVLSSLLSLNIIPNKQDTILIALKSISNPQGYFNFMCIIFHFTLFSPLYSYTTIPLLICFDVISLFSSIYSNMLLIVCQFWLSFISILMVCLLKIPLSLAIFFTCS